MWGARGVVAAAAACIHDDGGLASRFDCSNRHRNVCVLLVVQECLSDVPPFRFFNETGGSAFSYFLSVCCVVGDLLQLVYKHREVYKLCTGVCIQSFYSEVHGFINWTAPKTRVYKPKDQVYKLRLVYRLAATPPP